MGVDWAKTAREWKGLLVFVGVILSSDPALAAGGCDLTLDAGSLGASQDIAPRLQALHDDARIHAKTGGTICVPWRASGYRLAARNSRGELPSLCKPKFGVLITKNNVFIRGLPGPQGQLPTIRMDGLSVGQLNALSSPEFLNSPEFFSVVAFVRTEGGGVSDLRFDGTNDLSQRDVYEKDVKAAPMARGISVTGGSKVSIRNVEGYRILGNLLKIVPYTDSVYRTCSNYVEGSPAPYLPSGSPLRPSYLPSSNVRVESVTAAYNLESGINSMTATRELVVTDAKLFSNGSAGIEAGGSDQRLEKVIAFGNRESGIVLNGKKNPAGLVSAFGWPMESTSQVFNSQSFGNGFTYWPRDSVESGQGWGDGGWGIKVSGSEEKFVRNSVSSGNRLAGLHSMCTGKCRVENSVFRDNNSGGHPAGSFGEIWNKLGNGIEIAENSSVASVGAGEIRWSGLVTAYDSGTQLFTVAFKESQAQRRDDFVARYRPNLSLAFHQNGVAIPGAGITSGMPSYLGDGRIYVRVRLVKVVSPPKIGQEIRVEFGSKTSTRVHLF